MAYIEYINVKGEQHQIRDKDAVRRSELFDLVYPVGSIYMNINNVDPEILFGGEWEKIEGRFLLAASPGVELGSTGGSANSTLPSHTHRVSGYVGVHNGHSHGLGYSGEHTHVPTRSSYFVGVNMGALFSMFMPDGSVLTKNKVPTNGNPDTDFRSVHIERNGRHTHVVSTGGLHQHSIDLTSGSAGASGTGKNMPPYVVVNIWKRIG